MGSFSILVPILPCRIGLGSITQVRLFNEIQVNTVKCKLYQKFWI